MNAISTMPGADAAWYAVQAKPRQESRAEVNLRTLDIETFLPQVRPLAATADSRRAPRIEPLFPGYLFVRCDVAVMYKVGYTRGVARLVGNDSGPAPITGDLIDIIRSRVGADGFVQIDHGFRGGDPVRIRCGPLKDFVGVFDSRLSSLERVAIMIRTVTNQVRVIVDCSMLERVS